ncbi:small GTPase Rab5b [Plasmodium vivax India VII]|uniref:Small GTPase Rab5b, putative n=5 Tax=Plasmodium vivax TaxID=5855 RepID=A5JZ97_PLAVS|nr:small GTPase Rab5b, putative [Plasmodium vivax]KMZ77856.1 small GTPase Rab5b [Plasmodium vivax India VII]KMZ84913.1 small GTPase Rab5b [Plasmodium vivax Brazil I]KMZ90466.1 small GTPase Rab5b [Plasmodium vivax Mauritania I]KMZ97083.1 small GTPase Rab5b [Plasmodium vivax North Korean]EDL47308.1 small GTPase Rab5b, putative [Plasmodium vivax]|eukprot:XP_001617035.1 small GTPase Rab5b [Plasmodium vivax Sal-1]
MGCASSSQRPTSTRNINIVTSASEQQKKNDTKVKIVLLGDSGVGKSSIALYLCHGRFSEKHQVTIGAAFLHHTIELKNGATMKLHIWDTGGQERFRSMAPLYYRDAYGAVVVYDSNNVESFNSLKYWINEIKSNGSRNCCIMVVANKKDLPQKLNSEMVMKFCEQENVSFIECSAKVKIEK